MLQGEDVYRVGKQGRAAASPTSVLEEDSWFTWESSSLIDPPVHASPLRPSSMSSPLRDTMQHTSKQGVEGNINNSTSGSTRSLVETLQNCLTSLPQSTNCLSDPMATTTSRQCSSRPPCKRRPRVSRRTPTTILETNPNEFRDMVQKLTGIPSATPGAAPVRPHPQRASPTNLVRPETLRSIRRLPPMSSPPRPPLTSSPITFLRHLQRNHTPGGLYAPNTASNHPLKREFPEESSHESMMKRAMSAPTTSMESWWSDNDNSHGPNSMSRLGPSFPFSTGDALTNAILSAASGTTASPDFARLDSADGQLAQEEQDSFFNQMEIESWLSAQDHTLAESMRG